MANVNFSIFAQGQDEHTSAPQQSVSLNLNTGYYSLFAFDAFGQVSGSARVKIAYLVDHYAIFSEDADNNVSGGQYIKCISQPIPFPVNVRVPSEFVTSSSFKVIWDQVAGINLYRVYIRNINTNTLQYFDSNVPEYVAINLDPGNLYEVRVASHLELGTFSANISPIITQTLDMAIAVSVVPTKESLNLFWQEVAGAALYKIYRGVPGGSDAVGLGEVILPGSVGYKIDGLVSGTQYTFSVVAINAGGQTIASGTVTERTLTNIPESPNYHGFVVTNITPHSFDIKWAPVVDADYYSLFLNNNHRAHIPYIYGIVAHVDGLRPDAMHAVSIMAHNNAGKAESRSIMVKTMPSAAEIPLPPRLIFPNADHTTADPTPTLYWEVPGGREGDRYDFIVEIAEDADFTKNVRKINSSVTKKGFSYVSPREANSGETVSFRVQDALVIY
jgi:hypothetical protein